MENKQKNVTRNLTILSWMGLSWMGLGCQAFGVFFAVGSMFSLVGDPEDTWKGVITGMVSVIFGMALSGWAGNLLQITELKKRVAELEGRTSHNESRQ